MVDLTPVNFLDGLGGLANLPHPYDDQQQVLQDQATADNNRAIVDQRRAATDAINAKLAQQQAYSDDVRTALAAPTPQNFAALIAKYPEQHDALKQAWDAQDEPTKRTNLQQLGGVFSFLSNGKADLAAKTLQSRIDAEKKAGLDTSDDEQILELISSGKPEDLAAAKGIAGYHLAAVLGPEKFGESLKQLGIVTTNQEGKVVGNTIGHYEGNKFIPDFTAPEKPEYRSVGRGDSLVRVGGGDPASDGPGLSGEAIESTALSAIPGLVVTSRQRTPEHNAEVGGVPGSYHISDLARDFAPPAGMSLNQAAVILRQALPGAKIIKENDHIHVQAPSRSGGGGAQVVATGAPKPSYQMLTPQEVATIPGLDPSTAYQRSPDGQITAVGGTNKGQLKPLPPKALDVIVTNNSSLKNIDQALALLDPNNKSKEAAAARYSIGTGNRFLPNAILQHSDEPGNSFRAQIGQIGGVIIKDISGAAVSASEDDRLAKWVPQVTDTPSAAIAKLKNLKREIMQRNQSVSEVYGEDQGYRPYDAASSGPATKISTTKEWSALPKGAHYIDPKGVRRVKS